MATIRERRATAAASGGTGVTRRQAMRGGLVAGAAAAVAGSALTACAQQGAGNSSAAAAPNPYAGATQVPFQLWTPAIPTNATTKSLIQDFTDQSFNSKHKGVRAVWVGGGNMSGVATSVLAGASNTPWVVASCCGDWPIIQPFLERLDPYFQNDNINPATTWQPGQLSRFQDAGGTYGLPEDAASDAYLYRQDILDELGLPYPDPTWTSQDAANLWRACTGQGKTGWRYGVACPFGSGTTEGLPTVVAGFGGQFQNPARTVCLLDSPQAIQAGEYWIQMVWDKVGTDGDGTPNAGIFNGTVVFTTGAEPTILQAVQRLGSAVKWDFLPWPAFPTRKVGKLHDNFYGMLSSAPNKELAWEVLRWAAIDPDWQRFYMSLALAPPAVASLLENWYTVMRATAPVLQNKKLEYWGDATLAGDGVYDYEFFQYSPSQALNVVSGVWSQIWGHKLSVTDGFRQITQQVNALEAQGAVSAKALTAAAARFPTQGSDIAVMPTGI